MTQFGPPNLYLLFPGGILKGLMSIFENSGRVMDEIPFTALWEVTMALFRFRKYDCPSLTSSSLTLRFCSFFFFFFCGHTHTCGSSTGQRLDLCHSSDRSRSSNNARSLTCCTPVELSVLSFMYELCVHFFLITSFFPLVFQLVIVII